MGSTRRSDYDLARAQELRDAFLVPVDGAVCVITHMTTVTFIDSTALRTLIHARTVMAERGLMLHVTHARPAVLRVFQLTDTAPLFGLA